METFLKTNAVLKKIVCCFKNSTFFKNTFLFIKTVMEQHTLKKLNNCLNTKIYCYLETSGGQYFNPYLNVVHFFNTSVS